MNLIISKEHWQEEKYKISVIIPTYNRKDILVKCLNALNNQTLPPTDYEIIVVDDGSTDGTEDTIKNLQLACKKQRTTSSYRKFTYLKQANKGPGAAKNLGIRHAVGELLLFMNDDIIADDTLLAEHLAAHETCQKENIAVLGHVSLAEQYQKSLFMHLLENEKLMLGYKKLREGQYYDYNMFWTCNISLPKSAVLKVGIFAEDFIPATTEDIELGYRLGKIGYKVLYYPDAKGEHWHSINLDAFCKREKILGINFVKLIQKHPEILKYTFGISDFDANEIDRMSNDIAANKEKVEQLVAIFKDIERFSVDEYKRLVLEDGASFEEKLKILGKGIRTIKNYYWTIGVLEALETSDAAQTEIKSKAKKLPSGRVLLSNPPWFMTEQNRWGIRAGSRWPFTIPQGSNGYYPFPFSLAYATSYLRANGIQAHMVDSILTRESLESYFRRIQEINFDWMIIETSTPSIDYDLKIAEEVSKYAKVALAGPHASVFAEEMMAKPFISAVLRGEYEKNALQLVKSGEERIYDYDIVDDIDSLPYPYRDYSIYRYCDKFPNSPPGPQLQMWGSRGCPFRCIFCLWPPVMYKHKYRQRQPDEIIKEIEETFQNFPRHRCERSEAISSVYFDDDTFNIGDDRVREICKGMRKLGIPWAAMCRADTSSIETFEMMAKSGCYAVKFGVESGCQELVDGCRKKLDLEVVKENVNALKKMGVWVHTTFTWGLPGETRETIKRTQEYYRELRPSSAQESICTPFPGTPYYDILTKAQKLDLVDWSLLDGARTSVINNDGMTSEELLQYGRLQTRLYIVGRMLEQHMGPWFVRAAAELGYNPIPVDLWTNPGMVNHLVTSATEDDIILVDKGGGLSAEILQNIKAQRILYYPDIMPTLEDRSLATSATEHAQQRYAEFSAIAPYFDKVILHDNHSLEYLLEQGHRNIVGQVILPFEPRLHRKLDVEKIFDIVFVGLISPYRKEILEDISKRFQVHTPSVWGEEMVKTINQAKIVLNIHYTPILNTEHRIIESLACGCFVLSQKLYNAELFEDRKHLVYFDNDDVYELIEYYLEHEEEREKIAQEGMEEVRKKYTAVQQLQEILSLA